MGGLGRAPVHSHTKVDRIETSPATNAVPWPRSRVVMRRLSTGWLAGWLSSLQRAARGPLWAPGQPHKNPTRAAPGNIPHKNPSTKLPYAVHGGTAASMVL